MSDLRKAAEQALEALEWINRVNAMDYEYQRKAQEPIQALRQALAQPEEKMRIEGSGKLTTKPYPDGYESERDFRKALAQPEQGNSNSNYPNTKANTSLKHEPWCDSVTKLLLSFPPQIPPCNCKPKREWVGLTDEDLKPLCDEWRIMYGGYVDDFAKAIEAKLKEKNT